NRFELLECKRIHPEVKAADQIPDVIKKLIGSLPGAIDQLTSTASIFGPSNCDKHLLVDISAYSGSFQKHMYGNLALEVRGGFKEEELATIAEQIGEKCSGLTRLTLSWHVFVWIKGKCL